MPPETNICSTMVTSDKSWLKGISQAPVCKMGENYIFHRCGKLMKYSYCINTKPNSKKNEDKSTSKTCFGKGAFLHQEKISCTIFY